MILALDCGNTRIKWGVHDGAKWLAQGPADYSDLAALAAVLRSQPLAQRAIVANVAGREVADRIAAALAPLGIPVTWTSATAAQCGVRNLYDEPQRLGADRWAALIGARHLHRGAALVVCAGTATTADVLCDDGTFQGGVILPGLDLMLHCLARNTAQLPLANGHFADLPRNTADAIVSGCLNAQAGAIERMFAQIASAPDALCLVSGGAAAPLFDLLRVPKRHAANLVLEGLACIGRAEERPA
jgi:type III pantothenate kinase